MVKKFNVSEIKQLKSWLAFLRRYCSEQAEYCSFCNISEFDCLENYSKLCRLLDSLSEEGQLAEANKK